MQKFSGDTSFRLFFTRLPYTTISEKIILQLYFIEKEDTED